MSSNYCRGKSKSGAPCRAPAGRDGLCFFHANPEQARALGQDCRLIPIADLEERVVRLEQYIAEHQRSVPNPDEAETNGTPTSPDEDTQEETEQGGSALPHPSQPVDMDTENGTQRRRRRMADGEEP